MSLIKAIDSGKEHRKQYRGAKRYDKTCRNNGSCPYCQENRTYQSRKLKEKIVSELKESKNANEERISREQ